jgi:hypothetical protein
LREIAPPRQLNRYVALLFEKKDKPARDLSLTQDARLIASSSVARNVTPRLRVSVSRGTVVRYRRGPHNKSLHASRISGLLIDSLRVSQLRAAA